MLMATPAAMLGAMAALALALALAACSRAVLRGSCSWRVRQARSKCQRQQPQEQEQQERQQPQEQQGAASGLACRLVAQQRRRSWDLNPESGCRMQGSHRQRLKEQMLRIPAVAALAAAVRLSMRRTRPSAHWQSTRWRQLCATRCAYTALTTPQGVVV